MPKISFLFFVLEEARQASAGRNFVAQLRTRARFSKLMLRNHRFFSSEMKTGKQKCRTVCVFFLRTLIFSKEMDAQSQLVRDVCDQMAFFEPRKGCPRSYRKKKLDLVAMPKCRRELDFGRKRASHAGESDLRRSRGNNHNIYIRY